MKTFINKTLRPFLILFGAITAGVGMVAIAPEAGLNQLFNLAYDPDLSTILRHWGWMVSLCGIMMIISAFKRSFTLPVLIYTAGQKSVLVILYGCSKGEAYASGFRDAAVVDTIAVLYILFYLYVRLRNGPQVD